ncbi:MAG TPA: DUF819 family protein [Bacteroidetes bacterium]|nr:DUF819 family protein [Bacteroidota bacterium]
MSDPLLTNPTQILAFLIFVIGLVYRLDQMPALSGFFRYLTPVIWIYFLPMLATTLGIIPQDSAVYAWIRRHLLPAALILLLLSANLPTITKLGGKAILTMLAGTFGIVIGGPIVVILFKNFLPAEAWRGIAALSGSWIGGSVNMVAISESVHTPESLLGPIIVVDTVVGYGWMGVVIALSGFQNRFDKWAGVDRNIVDDINEKMGEINETKRRPLKFFDLALMMTLAFVGGYICLALGDWLPPLGEVITSFAWTIILVSVLGIVLSFTRLSDLEYAGASHLGNYFLFLLLASIGARADLRAILAVPVFVLVGIVWIAIHATCLFIAGKLLKTPMFLMATASQANIGGPVTAPIVASVYQSSMAPVGLLMAVFGGILGIYAGLLTAQLCFWADKLF